MHTRAMSGWWIVLLSALLSAPVAPVRADIPPEWVARTASGSGLSAGFVDMVVDPTGVSFITSITGTSSNTDVMTVAFARDGTPLWNDTFDGPAGWHDQVRGMTLAADGTLWVVGNTPDPNHYANVLLLAYDGASGSLLHTVQYTSGPFTSEAGAAVATDLEGNVYVAGNTTGDGPDVMVLKFDPAGNFVWKQTWDGPAQSPYSQDSSRQILVHEDGSPVVLIHGVMSSLHPDYVVLKLDADDGSTIWQANWGVSGGDFPREMEMDAAGDLYVTGTGIDLSDKFATIKLDGVTGTLLWQAYDTVGYHNSARAIALDEEGGVYITGSVDPDGDRSNSNGDMYTIKRDATTGALLWTHLYGASCIGCGDVPTDVIVAPGGHVFLVGRTSSPPYGGDLILFDLHAATGFERDRGVIAAGSSSSAGAGILAFDAAYNLYNGSGVSNHDTGAVEVSMVKYGSVVTNLYRLDVPKLVVGDSVAFTVLDGTPGKRQFIVFTLRGLGTTPVPQLNVTLGIDRPRLLGSGVADAGRTYARLLPIPARAVGRTVWLQAAEQDRVTGVVRRVVR